MNFENPLIQGVFIKRYKRFFADIMVKGQVIAAHCPNTGSMMGLLDKGNKVWISMSNNKKRKLKYTLQIIEINGHKVGVNTHLSNSIVAEGLKNNLIKGFSNQIIIEPEQRFGLNTRFDFFIKDKNKKAFLEVKNVTLMRKDKIAEFPDSVTERGAKHINDLIKAVKKGFKSYLFYLIQRENCKGFKIASDIDPNYSKLLTYAIKNNVKIICYDCKFSSKGIKLNRLIKLNNIND